MESWSCRTVLAGTEILANTAEHPDSVRAFREKLDERAQQVLQDANALCYEPLILEGLCIGSIGFHARKVTNYDGKKRAILRLLARRAAWALQDYLMARAIRKHAEAATLAEILGMVLHNIRTPLSSIRFAFDRLLKAYDDQCEKTSVMADHIGTIEGQLDIISRLQEKVVRLKKPWESRIEITRLNDLVRNVIDERLVGQEAEVEYSYDPDLEDIRIDTAAIETCLEILVDNAVDAIKGSSPKTIRIDIRKAELAEGAAAGSSSRLAIDVIDGGPGVPSDMVGRLFSGLQSRKTNGAGLGLFYGRRMTRSAGGDIVYDSNHSPGAKFTLLLPYTKEGT